MKVAISLILIASYFAITQGSQRVLIHSVESGKPLKVEVHCVYDYFHFTNKKKGTYSIINPNDTNRFISPVDNDKKCYLQIVRPALNDTGTYSQYLNHTHLMTFDIIVFEKDCYRDITIEKSYHANDTYEAVCSILYDKELTKVNVMFSTKNKPNPSLVIYEKSLVGRFNLSATDTLDCQIDYGFKSFLNLSLSLCVFQPLCIDRACPACQDCPDNACQDCYSKSAGNTLAVFMALFGCGFIVLAVVIVCIKMRFKLTRRSGGAPADPAADPPADPADVPLNGPQD